MSRVTINKINAAIGGRGFEIVKGVGYWYFAPLPGQQLCLSTTMVCVTRLSDMPVEGWVSELDEKIAASY